MSMFRGGHRRYMVFMRRCARDGMISSLLLIGCSLWGMALAQAAISAVQMIMNSADPWHRLAYIIGVFAAMWIVVSVVFTLLLAWYRYRQDQEKFIKVMSETP